MITAVSLSPALDVTYEVEELVEGHTHRPTAVHRHPGGKAVNLARAAAALGADVRLVVPLPPDRRRFFADDLADDEVEVRAVDCAYPLRTCFSVSSAASGLMTEVYEHPPVLTAAEGSAVVAAALSAGAPGWLAISGSVRDPRLVVDLVAGAPTPVAVDSHGPALEGAVAAGAGLVKVNRAEASGLVGDLELEDLAEAVQRRTKSRAVVTDSVHGVAAADGETTWRIEPVDRPGSFPQGSGDSFLGGLLAALDLGAGWPDALRLAVGCAVANAQIPGGGRFDAALARRLADDVRLVAVR